MAGAFKCDNEYKNSFYSESFNDGKIYDGNKLRRKLGQPYTSV